MRPRFPTVAAATAAPLALLLACSAPDGSPAEPAAGTSPADLSATPAPGRTEPAPGPDAAPDRAGSVADGVREALRGSLLGAGEDRSGGSDEAVTVTIGAAGDILPHAMVIENARRNAGSDGYDFTPMFADVRPLLQEADLTLCHLETPISGDNTGLTVPRTLVFNSPTQLAQGLAWAGFDACDFASNHSWDRGLDGLVDTQLALEAAGLAYVGPMGREAEAGEPRLLQAGDAAVAVLPYSYTLLNAGEPNADVPDGAPWLEHYLWVARGTDGILDDAAQAREAGADFVVLAMHWGAEYQTEPTQQQREMAAELLASDDVDLILGSHAHVIQPCERIDGKLVAYGMGNFLSNQSPDTTRGQLRRATQEGLVLRVELARDGDGALTSTMTYQPTRVDLEGHVIRVATPSQHAETYRRTVETMESLGEGACDAEPVS